MSPALRLASQIASLNLARPAHPSAAWDHERVRQVCLREGEAGRIGRVLNRFILKSFIICLLVANSLVVAQSPPVITYIYDELGRLVGVVDPNGEAATYSYDAVGNILSITRTGPTQVSLIEFTPNGGPIGTSVTISGTAFSTTPSQNNVTFNGTGATVTSATANRLTTTVPVGATTGTIAVTAPAGAATSSSPFTVGASTAPTITGFTPIIGVAGTAVTITGTNFDPTRALDITAVNVGRAAVTTASQASLTAQVPVATGSGKISVATPAGKATSAQDFFIPPSPYVATDVVFSGRMAIGQTSAVNVGTATKIGLMLFEGATGQRVSLRGANSNISSSQITVYNVNSAALTQPGSFTPNGFIDTFTLPATGTFAILEDPTLNATGSIDLTLFNVIDATGSLDPFDSNGTAFVVNMPTPGQNAKLTFTGAANKRVSLKGSNSTVSGRTVSIQDPNGGLVVSVPSGTMNWFIDTQTLQGPGTYAVLVDPSGDNTGSTTLTLYEVPSDVSGPITTDGTPVTANMLVPGQNARLTFDSTGNRRISLKGSANSVTLEDVTIYNPSDATVVTFPFTSNEWFLDTMTLQDPGTYKIALDPSGSSIGSTTLRLYDVVDVTGPITPSGSSVTADMMTPGQNAEYTFSGVVDQRISLKVTGNTVPSQVAAIIDPDEIVLTNPTVTAATWFIDTMTLQKEGTYKVLLNPSGTNTGSTTLNLYDVPPDFMTSMEINGLAHIVPLTTPGRNGLVTFNGSYGQQATVQIPGSSIGLVTVTLLRPDGMTVMTTTTSASSSFNLATQQLPQTGTYTVTIDPVGANSGTMTIKVTVPPVDPPEE